MKNEKRGRTSLHLLINLSLSLSIYLYIYIAREREKNTWIGLRKSFSSCHTSSNIDSTKAPDPAATFLFLFFLYSSSSSLGLWLFSVTPLPFVYRLMEGRCGWAANMVKQTRPCWHALDVCAANGYFISGILFGRRDPLGQQEVELICRDAVTGVEASDMSLCDPASRPEKKIVPCHTDPCPPR